MLLNLNMVPKLHKSDIPVRPVISFKNNPVSLLAQVLNKLLTNLLNYTPKFPVTNSVDFTKRYSVLIYQMTSKRFLLMLVELILNLPKFCLSQDFFIFNKQL